MRFDVNLSNDARHDLAKYLRDQRLEESTRIARDTVNWVPCRFENTAIPDRSGREEAISQFHPLVRFVGKRLGEPEQHRRPAVAVRMRGAGLACEPRTGTLRVFRAAVVCSWTA